MITDYASLQNAVASWLKRDTRADFLAQVPTFIQLAEAEMMTGQSRGVPLRAREMQYRARSLMNEEYEWLPGAGPDPYARRFFEVLWVTMIKTDNAGNVTEVPLAYKDLPEFLRDSARDKDPEIYTIQGEQIRFKPVPEVPEEPAKLEFEISFYGSFDVLSDTTTTNPILTMYPQIYLWGSLLQAEGYIGNDPRIPLWLKSYLGAVKTSNDMAEEGRRGVRAVGVPQ